MKTLYHLAKGKACVCKGLGLTLPAPQEAKTSSLVPLIRLKATHQIGCP